MKKLIFALIVAYLLWVVMFSPLTMPSIHFWWMMTAAALLLLGMTTLFYPGWWSAIKWQGSDLLFGILLATLLWCIFWLGDKAASRLLDFARSQVESIYNIKGEVSPWLLTVILLFIIGPAEEIFWRGYVQRTLSLHLSPNVGFAVTTVLYALAHACSGNFMLVMAAGMAGVVWGLIYRLNSHRLGTLIVSHSLWDVAVFIFFPI